jgi:hypothetical protein
MRLPLKSVGTLLLATIACGGSQVRYPSVHSVAVIPLRETRAGEPLRAHMYGGELYVLSSWHESEEQLLVGNGSRYSVDRSSSSHGAFKVPLDSIALIELTIDKTIRPAGPSILAVWGVLSGLTAGICVADPKSCFGSCPTFYPAGGSAERPWAEGFSGSVARSMEATDLDALYHAPTGSGLFELEMRNEALETHAVRSVRLVAVPTLPGGRVMVDTDGQFHQVLSLSEPVRCRAPEGDCVVAVRRLDNQERRSWTDSSNLAARETIDLTFVSNHGESGLVIGARQTLVSTYLFYQTMAFAGRSAGEWLAQLERQGEDAFPGGFSMMDLIGGIEVRLWQDEGWVEMPRYGEQGPIAGDVQVIPLPATGDTVRVQLRLAQGSWRIDYLAFAELGDVVEPVFLDAESVEGNTSLPDSLAHDLLADPDRYLVTYPGEQYLLRFRVPASLGSAELFLESRGYYYEWMRSEWLEDEDPAMLALVGLDPAAALKRLAPEFKLRESTMERHFWASRFGRNEP